MTGYTLDSMACVCPRQVKFTLPGILFSHLFFFSPIVRVVLSVTIIHGIGMFMDKWVLINGYWRLFPSWYFVTIRYDLIRNFMILYLYLFGDKIKICFFVDSFCSRPRNMSSHFRSHVCLFITDVGMGIVVYRWPKIIFAPHHVSPFVQKIKKIVHSKPLLQQALQSHPAL